LLRVDAQKIANGRKNSSGYAGTGIAMATLVDSTVRVTIRHSDSEPSASEAATASVSRDEATGVDGLSKPAGPGDRIMAEILQGAGESPAVSRILQESPAILRRRRLENGEMAAAPRVMPVVYAV
jgi:hypothetical protein